ncbi:MAG: lactonase family protein [Treponema sp.]|jgi:6-phosphogluconolactonase|nr:lactonase family protein [Treponema sp.]
MAKFSGYIGAYTEGGGKSTGIYYFSMNAVTGVIEDLRPAAESRNPSFLAFSPSREFLYAVNEVEDGGEVSAYALREDGTLKFLNRKSSKGAAPCHISIDGEGAWAVVSNYSSGVLAALPIGKKGSLGETVQVIQYEGSGPDTQRQNSAHAHSFTFAPDFSNGFACDLGSDRVMLYQVNPRSRKPLTPWAPPFAVVGPGSGPRHGVFHPSGRFIYILHELSSTVDVFAYTGGAAGRKEKPGSAVSVPPGPSLRHLQTISALPKRKTQEPSFAAAIRTGTGGKFLYTSNRGHDSITVFRILPGGFLEWVDAVGTGGKHPRDFILTPGGGFLAALNKDSDNLVIFRIDRRTGLPQKEREYPVLSPTAIVFK